MTLILGNFEDMNPIQLNHLPTGVSKPMFYDWLYMGFMLLTIIFFHMDTLTRNIDDGRCNLQVPWGYHDYSDISTV